MSKGSRVPRPALAPAIFEHAAVSRMTRTANGWTVATARGDLDARDVLIATNGYTDKAAPALQRRLIPIGSYVICTAPLADSLAARLLPRRRMVFDSRHFLHYFRLTADNRLLFGGRAEFSGPTLESAKRATKILQRAMLATFPDLAATPIEYTWSGHVAFTRDQMPHAGRLGRRVFRGRVLRARHRHGHVPGRAHRPSHRRRAIRASVL